MKHETTIKKLKHMGCVGNITFHEDGSITAKFAENVFCTFVETDGELKLQSANCSEEMLKKLNLN